MDLHHSGDKVKLLQVIGAEFSFILSGPFEDLKAKALKHNQNIPASLSIGGIEAEQVIVKTCTSQKELVHNNQGVMMPSFFENGSYDLIFEAQDEAHYSVRHMGESLENRLTQYGNLRVGNISFSGDIGFSSFEIYKEKKLVLTITIEVFPSKMDYMKDYQEMILEVSETISSLAFQGWDQTFLKAQLVDTPHQTNVEFIHILKVVFDSFIKALERIEKNPKHRVMTLEEKQNISRVRQCSRKTMQHLRKHPEDLRPTEKGMIILDGKRYLPEEVIGKKKITTIDLYENQYVKYMLQMIVKRLKDIEKITTQKEREPYRQFVHSTRQILEKHLRQFFTQISDLQGNRSMSLVFQMAPAYKEVYEKYMVLKKGLALGEDLYQLTPKKIYKLYEIWCYMKLHHILAELGYQIEEYGVVKCKDNGLYLSLVEDEEAKMVYRYGDEYIELWYNKSYDKLPTTSQRPDTVLVIRKQNDHAKERIYLFDAKYRLQVSKQGIIGPMEEDINVMHRYRDAIVSRLTGNKQFKYDTFGAYVMFPYWDETVFSKHHFYKSIEEVNIGGIPMLPGSTSLMTKRLKEIIGETLLEAKQQRVAMDAYDDYAKFKMENVMVVNVKNEAHLNKYLEHRFYHIPVTYLSHVRLGVTHVAFYQSVKAFGNDKGGIYYYAKIREVRKYQRGECIEIPKAERQEEIYLRFELEDPIPVGPIKPIQSGTQLVSYTTRYLLENASNMHELKIKSSLEIKVYKALREEAEKRNWRIRKQDDKYYMGEYCVEIIDGKQIKVNGKIVRIN